MESFDARPDDCDQLQDTEMQNNMRLSDFIRENMEPILQDWEQFSKSILHASHVGTTGLRDHARDMLVVIANDLDSCQTESEKEEKSKGSGLAYGMESWTEVHGEDRYTGDFSVMESVSGFRALRASVVQHWTKAYPTVGGQQLEDLTRFHEAIDQAVAESLEQYATVKEMETRLFGAILVASRDPTYVLDPEGRFIFANKASADIFGLQPGEIIGSSTLDLGFPFASDFQRNLENVNTHQSIFRGKFIHTFSSGQGERFEYLLEPVLDEHGNTEATVCIFRVTNEQSLVGERMWHAAHHDLLTGLPTRRLFLDRLEQAIKHSRRTKLALAVLFMDLEGFKEVNNSFGHETGDRLLAEVADRLIDCVREEDSVSRIGGDEFAMILTGIKAPEDVELVAQSIDDSLAIGFDIDQQPVHIGVRIGIAFFPRDASSPVTLMEAAGQAMHDARESASKRICCYGASGKTERSPVWTFK